MLTELAISNLGVIDDLALVFDRGLIAVTGETGAGKTMVVEALTLLLGGRADPSIVRTGCDEAEVSGRFAAGDDEFVVRRVVPRDGRTRSYINGKLATVGALSELGESLVDIHGQHAHQSLLSASVQRAALDRFGKLDTRPVFDARATLAAIDAALADLGGDSHARAREIDLYRYQVNELAQARLGDPDEDDALARELELLADAVAARAAALAGAVALSGERGSLDAVAVALGALAGRPAFAALDARLRAAQADLTDVARDLSRAAETLEEDPERLAEIRERRQLLRDLRRKYGATLADVIAYATEAEARLAELEGHDERAAQLDARRAQAERALHHAEAELRAARQAVAPKLAKAVERHLADLAMARARVAIDVDGAAGDEVRFALAANPGAPPLPLAKVASGGELARSMLALRLVLSEGPPTYVFDEVDAGIGGEAAIAVGRALAALAASRQVLVVTHLPQVAAFADQHIAVRKAAASRKTTVSAVALGRDERVVELSRMLSGSPNSASANEHAAELLALAGSRTGAGTSARERAPRR